MERVGVRSLVLAVLLLLHAAGGQQTELASKFYNSLSHVKACNGKLCVADRSKIDILNTDFTMNQTTLTCKKEDQCNNFMKVFLMSKAHTELVTCGSENGGCQVRSLANLRILSDSSTLIDNDLEKKKMVSNDTNKPAQASFTPRSHLLIAVTYGSGLTNDKGDLSYTFSSRPLSGSDIYSTKKTLKVTTNEYLMYFKGVFSFSEFTFFTTNQKEFVGSDNYVSKLVRFCNADTESNKEIDKKYLSYVDFEITCEQDGKKYNLIQDSVIVSYNGTDYFIGVFTAGNDPENPTGDSLVCVTPLAQTYSTVYTAWNQFGSCSDTETFTSANKRYFPKSWTSCTNTTQRFTCATDSIFPLFNYVLGITPLKLTRVYTLPGNTYGHVTKIFGRTLEPGLVDLHIGTSQGKVIKFNFFGDGRNLTMYSELTVHNGFSIVDFMDDNTTGSHTIFVASEKKIVKYAETNCSEFTTCKGTMRGQNPLCGWCIFEGKSTLKKKCPDQQFWLSSLHDCVTLTLNPEGQNVEETSQKMVSLTLGGFESDPDVSNTYECRYKNETAALVTVSATGTFSNLQCNTPTVTSHGYVTLELWSKKKEQPDSASVYLASAKFLYFQCSNFKSCGQCTTGTSCTWCQATNACQRANNDCASKNSLCPLIQSVEPKFIPSGVAETLTLTAQNLVTNMDGTYFCQVNGTDTRANVTSNTITCSVSVSFKSEVHDVSIWYQQSGKKVKLDDNNDLKVRLYRCEDIVKDCSHCKAVSNSRYSCKWQNGVCTYGEDTSSEVCPAPTIDDVTPSDGTFKGGTRITITGSNLGESISSIQEVKVGDKGCSLSTKVDEYDPSNGDDYEHPVPNLIVCNTPGILKGDPQLGKPVNVSLTVSSKTSVGKDKFTFKDSNITRIYPNEGPIAGGTLVTLTGTNLAIGNRKVTVRFNSHDFTECSEIFHTVTSDTMQCKTPQGSDDLKNLFLYINGYERGDVFRTSDLEFHKQENPIVGSVTSSKGTISGGTNVFVNGDYLSNAHDVKMVASYAGIKTDSKCLNVTSTSAECKVPEAPPQAKADLKAILEAQPSRRRKRSTDCNGCVEVDTVLHLDGVTYAFKLQYYPDPQFNKFGGDAITVFKLNTQRLILTGSNLNLVVVKDQIDVTIGVEKCIVVKLTENQLECFAPKDQPKSSIPGAQYPEVNVSHEGPFYQDYDKKVTVGNLKMQLGYLRYELDETIKQIAIIAGAVGGALVVVAVIGVVLGVLVYRRAGKRASALKDKLNAIEIKKTSREECYIIRVWANLVRKQSNIFDVVVPDYVGSSLDVLGQYLIDSCSLSPQKHTNDSPPQKLVFMNEVNHYRDNVKAIFRDKQETTKKPEVLRDYLLDVNKLQVQNTSFNKMAALYRFYQQLEPCIDDVSDLPFLTLYRTSYYALCYILAYFTVP